RPALWIVAAAFVFHTFATAGQWGWLQWQSSRLERAIAGLARTAAPESTSAPMAAIAQRLATLRHRAGLTAENDLLPLLARAARAAWLAAVACGVALVVWLVIVQPLARDSERVARHVAEQRNALVQAQRQADEIAALARETPVPAARDIPIALDSELARQGFK